MTALRVLGVLCIAAIVSAHVGSPDVFFSGTAGDYNVQVIVRPPTVVPGVAQVTVQAPASVERVRIRPVYWRAGSAGAPQPDAMRLVSTSGMGFTKVSEGHPMKTFDGSLWLMSSGAYSVDVILEPSFSKSAHVLVPVPAVATGRLALDTPLAAVLTVLGLFLVTGLINIVRKAAGESLLPAGRELGDSGVRTTRIAGVTAIVVLSLAIFGGARWWGAVDDDYARSLYQPGTLNISRNNDLLRVSASDTLYLPGGRPSSYLPDHGKLMHLFLVKEGDARAFAHLHPVADTNRVPAFTAALPPLPAGKYFVYGDVVQETGFERTLRGTLQIPDSAPRKVGRSDPDDAWFAGDASATTQSLLADGTTMTLDHATDLKAGEALTLSMVVKDARGLPVGIEEYLGMAAHAVVVRSDGEVYVHLHPMGTVTAAAQEAFAARDRGDTTATGELKLGPSHATMPSMAAGLPSATTFPYAFPKPGDYRVFVQVKRAGRVLTGAFAVKVGDAPATK